MGSKRRRKTYRIPGTMKRFSQAIHVSKQPNPIVLAEAKERAKGLAWGAHWYHLYLDRKYPGVKQDSPERLACLEKMKAFADQLPIERSITVLSCSWKVVRYFYTDDREKFFYIEEEFCKRRIRRSINYSSEARAKRAFEEGSITWKSEFFVPLD